MAAPFFCLALAFAPRPGIADAAADQARAAAQSLQSAVDQLSKARGATDRVAALTKTIQAYETGMEALRAGLRRVALREDALDAEFAAKRDKLQKLLGALSAISQVPQPVLLAGPDGPLGTLRAGMLVSSVTPALQAEAEQLAARLKELSDLHAAQRKAETVLSQGMSTVQAARLTLSQAVSNRTDLPHNLTESDAELKQVALGVKTLGDFADLLSDRRMPEADPDRDFESAKGSLPLPVEGHLLHRAGEADKAGITRPGLIIATPARALVTAPWPGTIRYIGPLLDYGNVMILEPGGGYLLVFAGLDQVYGKVGDVITAGTPIGMMGGQDATPSEFVAATQDGSGAGRTETLYIEIRQGSETIDPDPWFAKTKE
ncbi:peptidase M23 [Thioclava sp. BHET1]|nr:peptidase M23 [Thioclava sp. BHET1]